MLDTQPNSGNVTLKYISNGKECKIFRCSATNKTSKQGMSKQWSISNTVLVSKSRIQSKVVRDVWVSIKESMQWS